MKDKYTNLSQEHFNEIIGRYEQFQDTLNDTTKDPVRVFNPLSAKSLVELELIREVSKDLQRKKEEDVKKAAAQAAENQEAEEKKADEAVEEKKEEAAAN